MSIRGGRSEDVGAMVALERQAPSAAHWPKSFYLGLFEDGAADRVVLVAEDEVGVRGFLLARIIGDECELENIVMGEGSQRRGLGSKLIRALMDAVRDRNAVRIFLEVRESNTSARRLYEKCDFVISGYRKSYYSDPAEDAVLYTRAL